MVYQSRFPLSSDSFFTSGIIAGSICLSCLFLCGCEKAEQISTYSVPRHDSLQTAEFLESNQRAHPKPERMIGIVIPRKTALWFFKLQGNIEAVAARENDVRDFLKSVRITGDDKIEWKLPENWKQMPASDMRYATLLLGKSDSGTSEQPSLEMSVTTFPARPDLTIADQVVLNINRWRGQLSLPPIGEEDLESQSEKLAVGDDAAWWLNIIGRPKPKPAGMGPRPQAAPKAEVREPASEPKPPACNKPAEWTEGPPAMFAVVSFQVADGDAKAAITVTPARGNRLENVNRWRGQLGLGPLTENELVATAKKVDVGTQSGDLYKMSADGRSIFGVIVDDRDQSWFVKMTGDATLVEREGSRFETFLKSLQLN